MPQAIHNFERIFYLSKVFIEIKKELLFLDGYIYAMMYNLMVWYLYTQREYVFIHPSVRVLFMKISTLLGRRYHVEYGWMIWFFVVFVWWTRSYLHLYAKFWRANIDLLFSFIVVFLWQKRTNRWETLLLVGLIWGNSCFMWKAIKFYAQSQIVFRLVRKMGTCGASVIYIINTHVLTNSIFLFDWWIIRKFINREQLLRNT